MKVRGKVVSYHDVSGVSKAGKQYSKAELVIQNNDGYKDAEAFYHFTLFAKAMERFSNSVGDEVDVEFNIECKEYKQRWFTNLIAWKVQGAAQTDAVNPYPALKGDMAQQFNEQQDDNLPF
jgi:hypothetical protein